MDGTESQLCVRIKGAGSLLVTGDLEHDNVTLGEGDVEVGLLDLGISYNFLGKLGL
jgi:hypothetical protein